MKVFVTGADGFVGAWLIPRLVADGHEVVGGVRPGHSLSADGAPPLPPMPDVRTVDLELLDTRSIRAALTGPFDAVVHLAAVSSGTDAQSDPGSAWEVNAVGTARLAEELGHRHTQGQYSPVFLLASTAEVYGPGTERPRVESDPPRPCSVYAASKLAAEIAALAVHRRTALRVVIARAFAHTGAGQDGRFVIPAFAQRILAAKESGAPVVKVGNLEPVREFLHVSDVIAAYVQLLDCGEAGQVYNIAGGKPVALGELFTLMGRIAEHRVIPETDAELMRRADIEHLVGDSSKLHKVTGWEPRVSLEDILAEVLHAQAN